MTRMCGTCRSLGGWVGRKRRFDRNHLDETSSSDSLNSKQCAAQNLEYTHTYIYIYISCFVWVYRVVLRRRGVSAEAKSGGLCRNVLGDLWSLKWVLSTKLEEISRAGKMKEDPVCQAT